jgi:hypothetical protein
MFCFIFIKVCITLVLKQIVMGLVYADIEIVNAGDMEMARRHIIGEEEIKRMHLNLLIDTGSYTD